MESLTAFAAVQGVESWPDLPTQSLPDFPVDALPDEAADFCKSLSDSIQVSPDMTACFVLGVASAATVGRIMIKPMQGKQYAEPAQLYLICRGDSGERKSPTMSAVTEPLRDWISMQQEETRRINKPILHQIELHEWRRKRCGEEDLHKLRDEIESLRETLRPDPVKILGDITVEAITKYMAAHEGKGILFADEPNLLQVLTGKSYSPDRKAVNLDAVLSGYTGGYAAGMRVGGGEWHIDKASLSICIASQPNVLEAFTQDSASTGRGLQGRFLYFLPASKVGQRSLNAAEISEERKAWWANTVKRMAETPDRVLPFDQEAESHFTGWWHEIESRLISDLDGPLRGWGAKLCGNMVRVAGLLALLEGCSEVRCANWDAAEALAEQYFIPCAKILFCDGDDRLTDDARILLQRIEDGTVESEFWRDRGRFLFRKDRDRFKLALQCLQATGYLRPESMRNDNGKCSVLWRVNPQLKEKSRDTGEIMYL